MKKITLLSFCLGMLFAANSIQAQIYSNGGISTGSSSSGGIDAPTGYEWSELQAPGTLLGTSAFFNTVGTSNFKLADEFEVEVGQSWDITAITFYGYQTGYTGTVIPIDILRVQIYDGDPSLPASNVVFGDMTTNVLDLFGSGEAMIYRTSATTGTTRKVWKYKANVVTTLAAGTYWLVYQYHTTNDAAGFVPPVTFAGVANDPSWNAKQNTGTAWVAVVDAGTTLGAAVNFDIDGTVNTLAVAQNQLDSSFSIAPNPVQDLFSVKTNSNIVINSIEIITLEGKTVKQIASSFEAVNISDLASGSYFVRINADKGTSTQKIIKL